MTVRLAQVFDKRGLPRVIDAHGNLYGLSNHAARIVFNEIYDSGEEPFNAAVRLGLFERLRYV